MTAISNLSFEIGKMPDPVSTASPELVPVNFLPAKVEAERRRDGTLVLRSPEPLGPYARCLGEYLEYWAKARPDQVYLAQHDGAESERWRTLTYAHARKRVRAISALSPVAQDIVITGHDRSEIGFLIFPSLAGCRSLCPNLGVDAPLPTLLADARVRDLVREGMRQLKAEGGGSSTWATRALFLAEPPAIDAGEITDKGYINQRAVLGRRAAVIERLYDDSMADVIRISGVEK